MKIEITRAGFFTTVQDAGRIGGRAEGVPLAGALDEFALRVANILVGNDERAAGIEVTFGASRFRFHDDRVIAWCGGGFPVSVASRPIPPGRAALVRPGDEIAFERARFGARAWLALSGGVDVPEVLGSRATDLRNGFGGFEGRALRDGDLLPLFDAPEIARKMTAQFGDAGVADWGAPASWSRVGKAPGLLRFVRGEDWEALGGEAQNIFTGRAFYVSAESDRMGVRFERAPLPRAQLEHALSAPVAPGTVQVPPSGDPILLLADCQTVGGYPKIAHVISVDLPVAAQLHAREQVRFREVALAEAQQLWRERDDELSQFKAGLALKML